MKFLVEDEPARGTATLVATGIRRLVAPNTGRMTYHGTNTYLLTVEDGEYLIDPGPADDAHIQSVLAAIKTRLQGVIVTHRHKDHVGLLPAILAASPAPVYGFASSSDEVPVDIALTTNDRVAGLTVIHTPGHAPDHLCFARDDGVVFTGDHVMGWSSSIVAPPYGDMAAYYRSLGYLLDRNDTLYLPGHGPPITNTKAYVAELLQRRQQREAQILETTRSEGQSAAALARLVYSHSDPIGQRAAERNVLSHLLKLRDEELVVEVDGLWSKSRPIDC